MTKPIYIAETTLYRLAGYIEGVITVYFVVRFEFWVGFIAFILARLIVGQLLALIMANVPTVSSVPPK